MPREKTNKRPRMLTIRSACNDDKDAIKALIFGVLAEYGMTPDLEDTDADLDDVETHYLACGGVFEVLTDDDATIVGTVGLRPMSDTVCELRKMFFHRSIRGQGWGKAVLNRMIELARERGFLEMQLQTATVLKEAQSLYQAVGFVPVPADPEKPRCDRAYRLVLANYKASFNLEPITIKHES